MRSALLVSLFAAFLAQQSPVRDVGDQHRESSLPTGTASVSVTVLNEDGPTPQPVRRASVILASGELNVNRTELTDEAGNYTFDRLVAGRYTLEASKGGYVRMAYGSRRVDGQGTPIAVANGQHVDNLVIKMPHGAVITGTVIDGAGRAAPGVSVGVMQYRRLDGERRLGPPAAVRIAGGSLVAQTDEQGVYRLYGLPAGEYAIRAMARNPAAAGAGATTPGRGGPAATYSYVYYPGTTEAASVSMVKVAAGEERAGADFQLQYVPVSRVAGSVSMPPGMPARGVRVVLEPDGPFSNGLMVGADGRFSILGVPPGQYVLWTRTIPTASPPVRDDPGPAFWAATSLSVAGQDIADLVVDLQAAMTLIGRVAFDASSASAPVRLAGIDVALIPVQTLTNISYSLRVPAKTDAAGAFTMTAVTPGRYVFQATVPPDTGASGSWSLKSAMVRGRDALDFPIEITPNQTVTDVVLTLTDATQEVSGRLLDAGGRFLPGFSVVIFPADARYWMAPSRRIRTTEPATDGTFVVKNLPVGDYRAAAVVDLGPDDASDAAFLQRLVASSVSFTLSAGDKKIQNLRIRSGEK